MQVDPVMPVHPTEAARTDQHSQPKRFAKTPEQTTSSSSRFEVVSEDGKDVVYRAIDPETGIILAQVPSEEVLRVAQKLEQLRAEGKLK
jgi:uncharacterized FlaG/YvyC family protein